MWGVPYLLISPVLTVADANEAQLTRRPDFTGFRGGVQLFSTGLCTAREYRNEIVCSCKKKMLSVIAYEYEFRHFYAEDMNGGARAAPNKSATPVDTEAYLPSSLDTSGATAANGKLPFDTSVDFTSAG